METPEKRTTPEQALFWFLKRQERKKQKQEQFQKDCESGKIDEVLQNGKPVN
ncbi:hypothetical protein [Spirosoma gilvum]